MPKHASPKTVPVYTSVGTLSKTSKLHRAVINRLVLQGELQVAGHLFAGTGKPLQPLFRHTGPVSTPTKFV
jgi:hypothetical protein